MEQLKISNVIHNMDTFYERLTDNNKRQLKLIERLDKIKRTKLFVRHQNLIANIIQVFIDYPQIFDGYTETERYTVLKTIDTYGGDMIAEKLIEGPLKSQDWNGIIFIKTVKDPNSGVSIQAMLKAKQTFMSQIGTNEYLYHQTKATAVPSILKNGLVANYNYFSIVPAGDYVQDGVQLVSVKVKISDVIDRLYPDPEFLGDSSINTERFEVGSFIDFKQIGLNPLLLYWAAIEEDNDDPIFFWMVVEGKIPGNLISLANE